MYCCTDMVKQFISFTCVFNLKTFSKRSSLAQYVYYILYTQICLSVHSEQLMMSIIISFLCFAVKSHFPAGQKAGHLGRRLCTWVGIRHCSKSRHPEVSLKQWKLKAAVLHFFKILKIGHQRLSWRASTDEGALNHGNNYNLSLYFYRLKSAT